MRDFGFALDERSSETHELEVHGNAVFVDPLAREFLHAIGNLVERSQASFASVGVAVTAEESDHLIGFAVDGGLDGGLASHEGFIGIGFRTSGHSGSLGDAEFGGASFDARDIGFDETLEEVGGAAELGVSESVRGFSGGHVVAIGINEPFAHHNEAVFFTLQGALHVGDEFLVREGHLRKQNDVGRIVRKVPAFSEGGSGGDPASVAAHDFEDGHKIALAHGLVVAAHLADGGGHVFDHGTVAGAVVGDGKVVIDGLGDTDDAEIVALFLGKLGDLVGGVLGIVAASVEKVADILRFEDFEHALEIGLVLELVAASAESRTGSVTKTTNGLLRLGSEIDEIFVKNSENAVERAVNLFDAIMIECFGHNAFDTGVNDRGRAS